jgi:hypothetical protein
MSLPPPPRIKGQGRIFQNLVSFERPLAVSRASCVPQEALRNVRKFKVAFSKVIRLLKKPQGRFNLKSLALLKSASHPLRFLRKRAQMP